MSRFLKIIILGSLILSLQAAEMSRRQNPYDCSSLTSCILRSAWKLQQLKNEGNGSLAKGIANRLAIAKTNIANWSSDFLNSRLLLAYAIENNDIELARLALWRGVDVNAISISPSGPMRCLPLERVVFEYNNAPMIKLLLDFGADPNAKRHYQDYKDYYDENSNQSVFDLAILRHCHYSYLLLEYGAIINERLLKEPSGSYSIYLTFSDRLEVSLKNQLIHKYFLPKPLAQIIYDYLGGLEYAVLNKELYLRQIYSDAEFKKEERSVDLSEFKAESRQMFYDRILPSTNLPYPLVYMIIDYLFG